MLEINEVSDHKSLIYCTVKKIKLRKIVKDSTSILLYYTNLNLKDFNKLNVLLKNIKTREEYQCNFKMTDEYIDIHLDEMSDFFTDYEASLVIALEDNEAIYYYSPAVLNSSEIIDLSKPTYTVNNYKWFIRILHNGELRLSCYKLITA